MDPGSPTFYTVYLLSSAALGLLINTTLIRDPSYLITVNWQKIGKKKFSLHLQPKIKDFDPLNENI